METEEEPNMSMRKGQPYTVESVYADALTKVKGFRETGGLSANYYNILMDTKKPDDLVSKVELTSGLQDCGGRFAKMASSTVAKIGRYTEAIDMIAQSTPEAYGLNIVGLLWGSLKFLLIIAEDIKVTYETIAKTLESVQQSLPNLEALIDLYGDSEVQLLHKPLIDIYAAIISLGLQTAEHLSRSRHSSKSVAHSAWTSLQADFDPYLAKLAEAGRRVEQAAGVEHMYATDIIRRDQGSEMMRQERFRREVRRNLRKPGNANRTNITFQPLNDAPMGLLSRYFTGRSDELAQLKSMISRTRSDDKPNRCAIVGMPGLGKTQLALKAVSDYFKGSETLAIFWVSVANSQRFIQGYTKILDIVDHIDRDESNQSVKLAATQRWLESDLRRTSQLPHEISKAESPQSTPLRWLLVCDNVNEETVALLRDYLPRYNTHGTVLFTTRHIDVAEALIHPGNREEQLLSLDLPELEDAVTLLCAEFEGPDSNGTSKAGDVVRSLGRLPFAISQAASFAKQSSRDLDYILHICQSERKLQMLSWDNRLATYEQGSVMAIFESRLQDLNRAYPLTSVLLKILSLMDPESIPVDIWASQTDFVEASSYDPYWAIRQRLEYAEKSDGNETDASDPETQPPLEALKATSGNKSTRRLLGRIRSKFDIRKELSSPRTLHDQTKVLHVNLHNKAEFSEASPQEASADLWTHICNLLTDPIEFPIALQRLKGLALIVFIDCGKALRMHDLVQLMVRHDMEKSNLKHICFNLAVLTVQQSLYLAGNPREPRSWSCYERLLPHLQSLVIFHDSLDKCNYDIVWATRNMGTYLRFRGQADESAELLLKMIPKLELYHGPESLDLMRNLFELAATYNYQGKFDAALPLIGRVAASRKKILGEQHPHYLNALISTSTIKRGKAEYEEAEALLQEVLRAYETTQERESGHKRGFLRILTVKNDLGLHYAMQDRYEEAIQVYEKTLDEVEQLLEPEDHTSITLMTNLADAYYQTGRQLQAQAMYERALGIMEDIWGIDHPATLDAMQNLARVYEIQFKWDNAEVQYMKILQLEKRRCGGDAHETLRVMSKLAHTYQYQERYQESIDLQERVVKGMQDQFGAEDDLMLEAIHASAMYDMGFGKHEEAERKLGEVISVCKQRSGEEDIIFLDALWALGELRYKQGRLQDAYELLDRALAGQVKSHANEASLTGTQRRLGDVCSKLGKDERAEALYKAALAGTEKRCGWPNNQTVYNLRQLGIFYLDRKRWAEAEPLERRAVEGREAVEGPNHEWTDSALCGLATALEGLGRNEEAEQLRRRVLRIRTEQKDTFEMVIAAKDALVNVLYAQGDEKGEGIKLNYEILEAEEDRYGVHDERADATRSLLWVHLMKKRKLYLDDLDMCAMVLETNTKDLGVGNWYTKTSLQIVLGMLHILATEHGEKNREQELEALMQRYLDLGVQISANAKNGRPIVYFGSPNSSAVISDDEAWETEEESQGSSDENDVFHEAETFIASDQGTIISNETSMESRTA